mmetsp:Transcript_115852/g.369655  ORF Transcript_115852/g.369655 Transcript_115852/m.369655 type:complete len:265 (-) Transcript_115852:26-820(-)
MLAEAGEDAARLKRLDAHAMATVGLRLRREPSLALGENEGDSLHLEESERARYASRVAPVLVARGRRSDSGCYAAGADRQLVHLHEAAAHRRRRDLGDVGRGGASGTAQRHARDDAAREEQPDPPRRREAHGCGPQGEEQVGDEECPAPPQRIGGHAECHPPRHCANVHGRDRKLLRGALTLRKGCIRRAAGAGIAELEGLLHGSERGVHEAEVVTQQEARDAREEHMQTEPLGKAFAAGSITMCTSSHALPTLQHPTIARGRG